MELAEICYQIILSVSKDITRDHIKDILEKNKVDFLPIPCPDALMQEKTNDHCFRPFDRHCDCDTTLGKLYRKKDIISKSKLRKMKKIYSSPEEFENEVQRLTKAWKDQLRREIETQKWLNFLQSIFSKVWRINLILHWQSKNPLIIKRVEKRQQTDITVEFLLNIEEDVMYEFVKSEIY